MTVRPSGDWMTPAKVAADYGLSPKTLANQRSRGDGFPYTRLPGGGIRYSRQEIEAYLAERTVTPGGRR